MDGNCQRIQPPARDPSVGHATFDYQRSLARLGGDPALFLEIVDLFLEDSPQLLDNARQALAHSDLESLERAAHSLKGLSVNFDAEAVACLAATIEQHAREHDLQRVAACFPDLEVELNRLQSSLARLRQNPESQGET